MSTSRSVIGINNDLIQKLEQAPIDLLTSFQKDGYGGALKFVHRFRELIDLVVSSLSYILTGRIDLTWFLL